MHLFRLSMHQAPTEVFICAQILLFWEHNFVNSKNTKIFFPVIAFVSVISCSSDDNL